MMRRSILVPMALLCLSATDSRAQIGQLPPPAPPVIESPAPTPDIIEPEPDLSLPQDAEAGQDDAVAAVGELRAAARTAPENGPDRLRLARALYRLGDLDTAIEECRAAIKLQPDDAQAHLQLGTMLMAKQEWRGSASVLKEALRLEPSLTHAHYNLGLVQYSLGNVKAAIQSYREALELQPYFPDARYRLALMLKVTGQDREAAQLMEEAAIGGVPQARLFLGNAYRNGQGVEKNLGLAIYWWFQASELGQQAAADAVSKLRRQAVASETTDKRKSELRKAFAAYRERLWDEFPEYQRGGDHESLGVLLRKNERIDYALPVLLREGYALSEEAQAELASLYEVGWDPHLAPFDKKILSCLEATAADGSPRAKRAMARIYAKGLGMPSDPQKARAVLKGLPKPEMRLLLDELGLS